MAAADELGGGAGGAGGGCCSGACEPAERLNTTFLFSFFRWCAELVFLRFYIKCLLSHLSSDAGASGGETPTVGGALPEAADGRPDLSVL